MKFSRFSMGYFLISLCLAALMFGGLSAAQTSAQTATQAATQMTGKMSSLDFHSAMAKPWEDHITWTRMYIVSFAAGLKDADLVATRLIQNQVDIGNAIKPYYGDVAGNKLTALLKQHIQGAVDILTAAKDKTKLTTATTAWYANGNDIATFLNSANPTGWPLDQIKAQMKMHLDATLQEATDRLTGNYAADIKDYDKVHDCILELANMLSTGIINQFPDKFSS